MPAKYRSSPTRVGAVLASSATWGARTLSVIARRGYFEPLTCRHWATVIGTLPRRLGSGPPVRLLHLAVTESAKNVSTAAHPATKACRSKGSRFSTSPRFSEDDGRDRKSTRLNSSHSLE